MPKVTGTHFFTSRSETSGWSGVHSGTPPFLRTAESSSIFQLGPSLRDPACGHLRVADPYERGRVLPAALDLEGAPRVERAPARQVDQVGRDPLDRPQRLPLVGVETRDGLQQRPCIWVLGVGEDVDGWTRLHAPAGVHHDVAR